MDSNKIQQLTIDTSKGGFSTDIDEEINNKFLLPDEPEERDCWRRVDDWLWYSQQPAFEQQANTFWGCAKGKQKCGLIWRIFWALVAVATTTLSFVCSQNSFISEFKYLTIWGLTMSTVTMVIGCFVFNPEAAEGKMGPPEKRFKAFRVWKIFTVLFEISLMAEMVIVPYFWAALWTDECVRDGEVVEGWPIQCWPNFLDHSVPLAVLLMDWMVNAQPLCLKHLVLIELIAVAYLSVNCSVTLITGHPVYPTMDWKSLSGILTPLIILVLSPFLWLLLVLINTLKLKKLGHDQMANLALRSRY